jgi:hypothetical protein
LSSWIVKVVVQFSQAGFSGISWRVWACRLDQLNGAGDQVLLCLPYPCGEFFPDSVAGATIRPYRMEGGDSIREAPDPARSSLADRAWLLEAEGLRSTRRHRNMMRSWIGPTLLALAGALASGCSTPCQSARARIENRYAECGVEIAKPEEPPVDEICSAVDGEVQKCFADCTDSASCEALTGEDEEAGADLAECHVDCSG